jgi:hypothetical protein
VDSPIGVIGARVVAAAFAAARAGYDWIHPRNGTSIICYSAQITADYRKYVHVYGAIDIDEFVRLFWDRRSGSKSKIPKAMEAPFLVPQNDAENRIKEWITVFSAEQTSKLEQDLFKQRAPRRCRANAALEDHQSGDRKQADRDR